MFYNFNEHLIGYLLEDMSFCRDTLQEGEFTFWVDGDIEQVNIKAFFTVSASDRAQNFLYNSTAHRRRKYWKKTFQQER